MAVTVIDRFDQTIVIGPVHDGWKVAVSTTRKFALPFWTGTSAVAGEGLLVIRRWLLASGVDALGVARTR